MSTYTIKPIQVEISIGVEDLEYVLKNIESIKEKHPNIVVTIRAQTEKELFGKQQMDKFCEYLARELKNASNLQ